MDAFQKFGVIVSIRLSNQYGFIEYDDHQSCLDAIDEMHNTNPFGTGAIKVE